MISKEAKEFLILGILNITPDSFSDGGLYNNPEQAVQKFHQLLQDGADQIDIGAESTRPGSEPITADEEWRRLAPVLRRLVDADMATRISLDTRNEQTMVAAAGLGVVRFNNVAGVCSKTILKELKSNGAKQYVAMHMHGEPKTMQQGPLGRRVVQSEVRSSFLRYRDTLTSCGWGQDEIFMDPGIGFGKDDGANLLLLECTREFAEEHKVLIGVSRKGFIRRVFGLREDESRDPVSKALEMGQVMMGAAAIRTHDVRGLHAIRQTMRT